MRIRVGSQQVQISGSTVLLTGASGGLGKPIAHRLRSGGATLVLTGRRAELLEELADELEARAIPADLAERGDVERLLEECGDVDVLVANAGLPAASPLERMTSEEIDRVLEVNLRASVALARGLLPGMLSRRAGHLVFMSSTAGRAATAGNPLYHATKFALRGLSGALRIDLHGTGVGCSCVMPGFIREAGMYAESGVQLPPGLGTRSPADVAEAVVRAIERDLPEVEVSTLALRAGTLLWNAAPDLASSLARRLGSREIASTYEEALRAKR
jgi:short-subunit dehydrogenase